MRLLSRCILAGLLTSVFSPPSFAQDSGSQSPFDEFWSDEFGFPGVNQRVQSITSDETGRVYVLGDFDYAGASVTDGLAMWDGSEWTGVEIGSGRVLDFEPMAGTMAAAITLNTDNPNQQRSFWLFDGQSWSLFPDAPRNVGSMAYDPDVETLYVTTDDSSPHRWKDGVWTAMGNGVFHAVVAGGGNVYAGARSGQHSYAPLGIVTQWSGKSWVDLNHPYPDLENPALRKISGIHEGPDGTLLTFANDQSPWPTESIVHHWDGADWHALESEGPDFWTAGVESDDEGAIYRGGFNEDRAPGVQRWDGSDWIEIGRGVWQGLNDYIGSLHAAPDGSLYAGGWYGLIGDVRVSNIARLVDDEWMRLGSGSGFPYGSARSIAAVLEMGPDASPVVRNVIFGNSFLDSRDQWEDLIQLTGSGWAPYDSLPAGPVAVTSDQVSKLYVAGVRFVAEWSGQSWITEYDDVSGPSSLVLDEANGRRYLSHRDKVHVWDDGGLVLILDLPSTSRVNSLVLGENGLLYAGGEFRQGELIDVAVWDGDSWQGLGSGPGMRVNALASFGESLFAGGPEGVSVWDGETWNRLPGSPKPVDDLAIDDAGYLYASGDFREAGSRAASRIARWDGFLWSALGSGLVERRRGPDSSYRRWLIASSDDGTLYATGYFEIAGGIPSAGIAAWNCGDTCPTSLGSFEVRETEEDLLVTWTTRNEFLSQAFHVLLADSASAELSDYERVGIVDGAGQSTTTRSYEFVIPDRAGTTYSVRLLQQTRTGQPESPPVGMERETVLRRQE